MERVAQVFASFEAAEQADDQFYADLTPQERLDLLLELIERHRSALGASAERLERVHRVVELANKGLKQTWISLRSTRAAQASTPGVCSADGRRCDFLANNRVVFDIKGDSFRLVAQVKDGPLFWFSSVSSELMPSTIGLTPTRFDDLDL